MFLPLFEQMRSAPLLSSVGAKLYTLALDAPHAPNPPLAFVDPWQGSVEAGNALVEGYVVCPSGAPALTLSHEAVAARGPAMPTQHAAFKRLHSFAWLRDARASTHPQARSTARALLGVWLETQGTWSAEIWTPALCAHRVYHVLTSYEWLGLDVADTLAVGLRHTLITQLSHLRRTVPDETTPLNDACAHYLANCAAAALLEQDADMLANASAQVDRFLGQVLLHDGSANTRKPADIYRIAKLLLTLRAVYSRVGLTPSVTLGHALQQTIRALKFFIAPDNRPVQLQGTGEHGMPKLNAVLQLAAQKNAYRSAGRVVTQLPDAGFVHAAQNKTWVMLDTGGATNLQTAEKHFATGAFECGIGKHRLFTSCGGHGYDPQFANFLRATAAHSCAVLNDTNSVQPPPQNAELTFATDASGTSLNLTHYAYEPPFGYVHKRSLFIAKDGLTISGVDHFMRSKNAAKSGLTPPMQVALRFHIHPSVQASLVREGHAVLLRLPNGQGFQFESADGHALSLETSIYSSGHPTPRRNLQIVLQATMPAEGMTLKWIVDGV